MDLFRAYCSAYKYETKQISKPVYLDQFDIWMETKAMPLWCQNIRIKSDVPILYKNKVIAVGKAVLSSEMMKEQTIGVAVKVRNSLKTQPEG